MADNTKRNIGDEGEYLKIQRQISDSISEQVNSFKELGKYSKDIIDNYADMQKLSVKIKKLNQDILASEKDISEEGQARTAMLKQDVELLKKEHDQLKLINKQMSNWKNLTKATFNSLIGYIKEAGTGFLEFDQTARDAAANIGLNNTRMNLMRDTIQAAGVGMQKYGVTLSDAVAAQVAYNDELGRSVMLSSDTLENMARIGKATGLGMAGMAGLTAQMEQFGLGAESSSKLIFEMYAETSEMGLNAGKVIKKFQENLGLLNKLNFRAGVKGLKEMAKFSEKYKLDMNAVASVADKVFRPEGAIEAAAQLQVLGGALASLGDPFQLMYKARNSPEELAKSLTKAASASAVFNEKTKEFEVNAYELDRMKEAASALGMDYQELVKTAKQSAKINMFEGLLGGKGLDPKQTEALSMIAEMSETGVAQINMGVDAKGKAILKDLKSLSKGELEGVLGKRKDAEAAAQQATGLKEQWTNLLNQVMISLGPTLEKLTQYLKPEVLDKWATTLTEWLKGFAMAVKSIVNGEGFIGGLVKGLISFVTNNPLTSLLIGGGLKIFGGMAVWAMRGWWLGQGFNKAAKAGGITSAVGNKAASAASTASPYSRNSTNSFGGASTQTPAQMDKTSTSMSKMGSIASMSASQLLAFGAAILMIGAGVAVAALGISQLVQSFQGLTGQQALAAFGTVVAVMGGMAVMLYFLATASLVSSGPLLAVGFAFLMIGGAVALVGLGISMIVDSFSNMFAVIGDNGASLIMAGLGFMSMAAGIGLLSIAMLALAGTSLLALPGLLMLGAATSMITSTAEALSSTGGVEGISKTIEAINSVDTTKLDALKDLSMWMALLGGTTTIKFDESLTVDGSIDLTGKNGSSTEIDLSRLSSAQKEEFAKMIFSTHEYTKRGKSS